MKPRIVIDARMYEPGIGISRYLSQLLEQFKLLKLTKKFELILIVKKDRQKEIRSWLGNGFQYCPARSKHYSLGEQIEIPYLLWKLKPDLVHFPHFNVPLWGSGKFVVTIHDLIKHHFSGRQTTTKNQSLYLVKRFGYLFVSRQAIKKAQAIIVPSAYWQKELVSNFKISPDKVNVTHEAVDPNFGKLSGDGKRVLKEYRVKQPFFLYVGSVYPHKNVISLLRAIKKTASTRLVIVCSRNVFVDRLEKMVRKMGLEKRVSFTGFVADDKLAWLYHQATALVHPSLMEGFGLTGLEAMAVQCPVLSSTASCLPEIYGPAVLYFDPLNPDQIADCLTKINQPAVAKKLIDLGNQQVKKYSWAKMARQTIQIYEDCLSL
ncbi:MAG: glycosyltransferase family 1 protein [Patescibacteria group bacterium]